MRTDEKELQEKIASFLAKYFDVEKEVWSIDYKNRIDITMFHKSDILHFYPIGIEIKTDDKKSGSTLGSWLKQCIGYTQKEFKNYGELMIITYPQIAEKCLSEGQLMSKHNVFESGILAHQNNVNTFLAQFGIGELQRYRHEGKEYVRIVFNAKMIWDQRKDLFRTDNYKLCRQLQYSKM